MGFDLKNRPTRSVGWLIAIAMTFNIVAQLLTLQSPDTERLAPWVLIVLSSLILAYAVYQIVRKRPKTRDRKYPSETTPRSAISKEDQSRVTH